VQERIVPPGLGADAAGASLRVLLIEEHPDVAKHIARFVSAAPGAPIHMSHVTTLHDACSVIGSQVFDAMIVDLALPDSPPLEALSHLRHVAPGVPVIVLHGQCDEGFALEAVRMGAQDCLAVTDLNATLLTRAVRYAIERHRFEARLEALAKRDELTGLANRTLFFDRLYHALDRAKRYNTKVGVLFLDVDRLKSVNDGLGHAAGDVLLRRVARRIEDALRSGDTLAVLDSAPPTTARLGGDEFAVVLEDIVDVAGVQVVADRLTRALQKPVTLAGQSFVVTASIGIAVYPDQGTTSEELMRHADGAMYQVKHAGRASLLPSVLSTADHVRGRLRIESDLRLALSRQELVLHYQPIWNLIDGSLAGAEALLRWRRARRLALPGTFIDALNETGLIIQVGRWVIEAACTQVARWRAELQPDMRISVNVCGRQLAEPGFVEDVRGALARNQLPATALELEIVENAMLPDLASVGDALTILAADGVRVALDDFGTGFSTLAHLRDHRVDVAKLDATFVRDIDRNSRNASIAAGMIDFGHRLGMEVVAEGVETQAQLDLLREHACDRVQGYLLGRPMPAGLLTRLARKAGRPTSLSGAPSSLAPASGPRPAVAAPPPRTVSEASGSRAATARRTPGR
jgi:diguanylate cyclase (GGDEF)-like protein